MPIYIRGPGIGLFNERPTRATVPYARPALVSPGEAEGKIRLTGRKHFKERALKQSPSTTEPVVPIAEPFDPAVLAIFACSARVSGSLRS